jgi:hypothetical protein
LILASGRAIHPPGSVIGQMGKDAFVTAPDWATLSAGAHNPKSTRLAALRGLAAMREGAQAQGKDLRAAGVLAVFSDPSLPVVPDAGNGMVSGSRSHRPRRERQV